MGGGGLDDMQKLYLLMSGVGGVADYFERRADRNEERRRYDEAMEERRRNREAMGRSLSGVWGP